MNDFKNLKIMYALKNLTLIYRFQNNSNNISSHK